MEKEQFLSFSLASQKMIIAASSTLSINPSRDDIGLFNRSRDEYIRYVTDKKPSETQLMRFVQQQTGIRSTPMDLFENEHKGGTTYAMLILGKQKQKEYEDSKQAVRNSKFLSAVKVTTPKKTTKGDGLKQKFKLKRRSFFGKGASEVLQTKTKKLHMMNKYFIDLNKLDEGLLVVKYTKSGGPHPRIKVQQLTRDSKETIRDILNNRFNPRVFEKMNADDKRVVTNFVKRCNLDVEVPHDLEFEKNYEMLRGEYISGNDSPAVKNELRRYCLHGINEGLISKSSGMLLLYQLSL